VGAAGRAAAEKSRCEESRQDEREPPDEDLDWNAHITHSPIIAATHMRSRRSISAHGRLGIREDKWMLLSTQLHVELASGGRALP
jgi:hypothetical protein